MAHCIYTEESQVILYFFGVFTVCQSTVSGFSVCKACADPESFARGGPTLTTFFLLMRGGRIQISLKAGRHRPTSETPFKWRFAGVPMLAQH